MSSRVFFTAASFLGKEKSRVRTRIVLTHIHLLEGSFPPQASQVLTSQVYANRPDSANLVSGDRSSLVNGCQCCSREAKRMPKPTKTKKINSRKKKKVITFGRGIDGIRSHFHPTLSLSYLYLLGRPGLSPWRTQLLRATCGMVGPHPVPAFLQVGSSGGLVSSSRSLLQSLTPPPLS